MMNLDREFRQAKSRVDRVIRDNYLEAWKRIDAMHREPGWKPPAPPVEENPAYASGFVLGQLNRALREMAEAITAGFQAGDRG